MSEVRKEDREFIARLLRALGGLWKLEDVHYGAQKLADYVAERLEAERKPADELLGYLRRIQTDPHLHIEGARKLGEMGYEAYKKARQKR